MIFQKREKKSLRRSKRKHGNYTLQIRVRGGGAFGNGIFKCILCFTWTITSPYWRWYQRGMIALTISAYWVQHIENLYQYFVGEILTLFPSRREGIWPHFASISFFHTATSSGQFWVKTFLQTFQSKQEKNWHRLTSFKYGTYPTTYFCFLTEFIWQEFLSRQLGMMSLLD